MYDSIQYEKKLQADLMPKLKIMKIVLIVEIIKYNIETNSNKNGFDSVEYYNNNNENDRNKY